MTIILASASPRRQELLDQIGVSYKVKPVDIDESSELDESAEHLVQRLAQEKAATAWQASNKQQPVLGADTLGIIDTYLLVKPHDYQHAHHMLSQLSGRSHTILTAITLYHQGGVEHRLSRNEVTFKKLSDQEIKAYWESGEPEGKAGAYAIQGYGAVFIKHIKGSYSAVMGLPLYETQQLLSWINYVK
ncbi:MAG: septum formation inhibitor Maf [Thiotrichaceae bacterium]|nr:septum formation inhibitor Maf [Thiotrichaceae bacterium]